MRHSDYPLQALLYAVVLHRFLRWRLPGYDPEHAPRRGALPLPARHVRARTRRWSTAHRAACSRWRPPVALVEALSDLLDGGPEWRPDERAVRADDDARPRGWRRGAHRAAARRSTRPACSTRPTSTSPHRLGALGRRDRRARCCSRSRWRCAPSATARSASTSTDGPRRARRRDAALARRPTAWLARGRGVSPLVDGRRWLRLRATACSTSTATSGGGAGLRRPASPAPAEPPPPVDEAAARGRRSTGSSRRAAYDEQRAAAAAAARQWTTVLTGGPGTGKTTTVAGLLALLAEQAEARGEPLRIALAAPTGKAAARLAGGGRSARSRGLAAGRPGAARRAVRGVDPAPAAGWRPDSGTRFRHDRGNRLPARRGRRRRDVDGVADDDGPAARGGPARRPAGPGRRPRPAGLGRGRRGARRPRRRATAPAPDVAGRGAARRPTGSAAEIGALAEALRDGRRRRGARRCCAAAPTQVEFVDATGDAEPRSRCAPAARPPRSRVRDARRGRRRRRAR